MIYRSSYVLNNIPYKGNVYYGFRITTFARNSDLLNSLRKTLKETLIQFIEECLDYNRDEFWFNMYFGYEAPKVCNASRTDNLTYVLRWEKEYGAVVKEKTGKINDLL